MKKWIIWFEQINQDVVRVEANTEDEAIKKAEKEWMKNNYPEITEIKEIKEETK